MLKLRILDLFCGAGGCSVGYARAGFEVVGVDIGPQPHYPFEFHQADALTFPLEGFDAIHASPPCQAYTSQGRGRGHPELIAPVRARVSGHLYVIENVVNAPLVNPILLCGSMFSLGVRRHRLFETNVDVEAPRACEHAGQEIRAYYGTWGREAFRARRPGNKDTLRGTVERAPRDMGIDWMSWRELTQAIPPVYTEYIGRQLLRRLTQDE